MTKGKAYVIKGLVEKRREGLNENTEELGVTESSNKTGTRSLGVAHGEGEQNVPTERQWLSICNKKQQRTLKPIS